MNKNNNCVWQNHKVNRLIRETSKKQNGCCVWFTGLSGSGKTTLANALEMRLVENGFHTYLLDGDNIRHGLCADLGFTKEDRAENIRRVAEVARLMVDAGLIVITAFISPFCVDRAFARGLFESGRFIEVFLDVPLELCESRDPKGLYYRARQGAVADMTGISSPYEEPISPEIRIKNTTIDTREATGLIYSFLVNAAR